jgi:hypothetical protein
MDDEFGETGRDEIVHEYWDGLDEICREHSTPKALRSCSAWLLLVLLLTPPSRKRGIESEFFACSRRGGGKISHGSDGGELKKS